MSVETVRPEGPEYAAGRLAFREGLDLTDNPHTMPLEIRRRTRKATRSFLAWWMGWEEAARWCERQPDCDKCRPGGECGWKRWNLKHDSLSRTAAEK